MAGINNVPRDVQESIRECLGRRVKVFIKRMMKMDLPKDKLDNRVLVFSGCRLFIFIPKIPAKLESNFNYLEIQALESKKPEHLLFAVGDRTYTFTTLETGTEEVNHMITHIATSLKHIFRSFPLERHIKKLDIQPPDRTKIMQDMVKNIEGTPCGPCGGFTMMYACMCDLYNMTFRAEVEWDIDTIYYSQDCKVLCLRDFDHLEGRDLEPIIGALENNTWFVKLNANDVKLTTGAQNEILRVLRRNSVLQEISLSNTGITSDFLQKMATALLSNKSTDLSSIDVSKNSLEPQALVALIGAFGSHNKGLEELNISQTKMTGKSLNKVIETLAQHSSVYGALRSLNISDNPSKGEDLQKLYNLLANPMTLTHLDLSGIDCSLELLTGPMLRGCCSTLTHLNLSRNVFTTKKAKDVQVSPSWKQFFSSAYTLQHLDLSQCKLPPEALREILLGLGSNIHLSNLHLDLSGNDLQAAGAQQIQECIETIRCVRSLNISNNGFDQSLINLVDVIRRNKNLKVLSIGKNFDGIKPKLLPTVLDSLVKLIEGDETGIESLSLADSNLRGPMCNILNVIGGNSVLTELDISGNHMGDLGARILSKALQINNTLRTIKWDKNNTTASGFEDIANALEKNYTLHKMPTPINDAVFALKQQQERTESALQKIESLLQRNHSPQKYSSDQGFRMQQGFLISSAQQMMDRLVVQNQDMVNALNLGNTEPFKADLESANALVLDADNSKQLLPQLQNIANTSLLPGNQVEKKLEEMSSSLNETLLQHIKINVIDMMQCAKTQCQAISKEEDFVETLQKECGEKSSLPKDFTRNILESAETDAFNKISELNLAIATHISDQVMDKVIDSLSASREKLNGHLTKMKSGLLGKEPVKTEPALDKSDSLEHLNVPTPKHDRSPSSSPVQDRKKTITLRKNRPPTVINAEHVRQALQLHSSKTADETPPPAGSAHSIQAPPLSIAPPPSVLIDTSKTSSKTENMPKSVKVTKTDSVDSNDVGQTDVGWTDAGQTDTADDDFDSFDGPQTRSEKHPKPSSPVPKPRIKRRSMPKHLSESLDESALRRQLNEKVSPKRTVGDGDLTIAENGLDKEVTKATIPSSKSDSAMVEILPVESDAPKLVSLGKDRPKRAKKNMATRPNIAVGTLSTDDLQADTGLDSFFKPASVTDKNVVVNSVKEPEKQKSSGAEVKKKDSQKEEKSKKSSFSFLGKFRRGSEPKNQDSHDGPTATESSPAKPEVNQSSASRLSPFKKKKKAEKPPENVKSPKNKDSSPQSPKRKDSSAQQTQPSEEEGRNSPLPNPPTPSKPEDKPEPVKTDTVANEKPEQEQTPPPVAQGEEKKEELPKKVAPKQALKPMFGSQPIPGFGSNMLEEIKKKQEFRKSQNLLDDPSPPKASVTDSPKENGSNAPVRPPPPTAKPQPAPRRNTDAEPSGVAPRPLSSTENRKSLEGKKPPPPMKPRPPKPANKPSWKKTNESVSSSTSEDSLKDTKEEKKDKTDKTDTESEIVYDSTTLRMSVGEKIKKMKLEAGAGSSDNNLAVVSLRAKSSSLPRNMAAPDVGKIADRSKVTTSMIVTGRTASAEDVSSSSSSSRGSGQAASPLGETGSAGDRLSNKGSSDSIPDVEESSKSAEEDIIMV